MDTVRVVRRLDIVDLIGGIISNEGYQIKVENTIPLISNLEI